MSDSTSAVDRDPSGEEPIVVEPEPPRVQLAAAVGWVRANLFSTPVNVVLTVVFGLFLAWVAYRALAFVVRDRRLGDRPPQPAAVHGRAATRPASCGGRGPRCTSPSPASPSPSAPPAGWRGPSRRGRRDSRGATAGRSLRRLWPVGLLVVVVAVAHPRRSRPCSCCWALPRSPSAVGWRPRRSTAWRWPGAGGWSSGVAAGRRGLVPIVGARSAGRTGAGCSSPCSSPSSASVVAFPLGVLVALARRSTLPALRWMATAYIELFRGVPLVTLLIMSRFVLLFMFPTWLDPPGAAGPGDDRDHPVRGRPTSPRSCAAGCRRCRRARSRRPRPSGLSVVQTTRRVVLPQALRAVIPAMVGQFISLFKDTSLLSILGFFELVDSGRRGDRAARLPGPGPRQRHLRLRRVRLLGRVLHDEPREPAARATIGGG